MGNELETEEQRLKSHLNSEEKSFYDCRASQELSPGCRLCHFVLVIENVAWATWTLFLQCDVFNFYKTLSCI